MTSPLLRALEARLPPPGRYLPALRALAAEQGVAVATVRKALAQLEQEGRIFQRVPRGRFATAESETAARTTGETWAQARTREETIASGLWEAWLAGEQWAGPNFPTVRGLMRRFEAGHALIRRALSLLESEGRLRRGPAGALHWVRTRPSAGRSEVYLVGDPDLLRSYSGPFFELLGSLETELFRGGWGPLRFWLTPTPLQSRPPAAHRTAALIHPLHGPAKEWRTFLAHRARAPVAVVDLDARSRGEFHARKGAMRLVLDHRRAGVAVAEALRSRGHREAVFLSHLKVESFPWLEQRWRGFREGWEPGRAHFLGPSARMHTETGSGGRGASIRSTGETGLRQATNSSTLDSAVPEGAARLLREGMHRLRQLESLACDAAYLFETALDQYPATAWVCVNDQLALLALGFLRKRSIAMPGRVSVVGFDNTREGFASGLTSYDFGLPALAHAAVAFFQNPRATGGSSGLWKAPGSLRHRELVPFDVGA